MNGNRAVLYLRLSKEDADKINRGDESASIKNQRLLLIDYARKNDLVILNEYSDDDESGLYDDRPAFAQMIKDSREDLFDVIIAKDQSRFTRSLEHVEKYLHNELPSLGITFIGVSDGTDTSNEDNRIMRQFNGISNEYYCQRLSKSIKASFKAKMNAGQFLGSSCPYGYKRDPENHNHLVIDSYAANIVKRIFQLYSKGYGKGKIGSILSSDGILIPTIYKKEVLGENYHNSKILDTTRLWSYQTIHTILNNQTYTGDMVQNKANTVSYRNRKVKSLPKSEWIIIKNTHEAIIDKETFDRVQELQKIRTKEVKNDNIVSVFSGLIFCADCKHSLTCKYNRRGNHEFTGYICSTYKTYGKKFCESHSIDIDVLEEAVLASIQNEARKILTEEDINELERVEIIKINKNNLMSDISGIESKIRKLEEYKKKTYKNFMDEIISQEDYLSYTSEYNEQIIKLNSQKETLINEIDLQDNLDQRYDEWGEAFKDYISIDKLTREIVLELIEKIEVHMDGIIDIYYRFNNPYEK